MEMFATILCLVSMVGCVIFLIAFVVHKLRKKPKNKIFFRGLLTSIIVFIISIILFAIFETPETKARYEQQRIERQKENEARALAEEQKEKEEEQKQQEEQEQKEEEEQKQEEEKAKKEEQKKEDEKQKEVAEQNEEISQEVDNSKETETSVEEVIKEEVENVIGKDNIELFNYVPDNNYALIKFKGSENLTSDMTVKGMYMDMSNVLKAIQNDVDVNVDINVTYPLQDTYGNVSDYTVIKATFNNDTIKRINFDNFNYDDIPSIADEWWNHPALG
ncbi:hypothetical protein H6A65_07385 [Mediterraneibacter glycyrrhizinilyticus]|uniref:hypothetical protein n=1 Tax=Mediterraneibacter glycyrrhizinilyticus TaxID=342942 RepID=UPI0019616E1F|nr:hypothetical protein [Mediterraneibacter glycyrrhizinilyticus]MBM6751314.1 hypothetical protein [Mediterraneibacter glycyrrhizinilyticus]